MGLEFTVQNLEKILAFLNGPRIDPYYISHEILATIVTLIFGRILTSDPCMS